MLRGNLDGYTTEGGVIGKETVFVIAP